MHAHISAFNLHNDRAFEVDSQLWKAGMVKLIVVVHYCIPVEEAEQLWGC